MPLCKVQEGDALLTLASVLQGLKLIRDVVLPVIINLASGTSFRAFLKSFERDYVLKYLFS